MRRTGGPNRRRYALPTQLLRLDLVHDEPIRGVDQTVGCAVHGSCVEKHRNAAVPRLPDRSPVRYQRNLQLQYQQCGAVEEMRGCFEVGRVKVSVGAGRDDDGVLPGMVDDDVPGSRGRMFVRGDVTKIHACLFQIGTDQAREHVVPESPDHRDGCSLAGRRDRLIGAFAAGRHPEFRADDSFSRAWQARCDRGQIDVEASNDEHVSVSAA